MTLTIGGGFTVVSAGLAWLTAGAMALEHALGRTVIPLFEWPKAANVPRTLGDPADRAPGRRDARCPRGPVGP